MRQPEHARLGRCVVRAYHAADVRGNRGKVDDAAPAARAHAGQHSLRHQEARLEVDRDQFVPIRLGNLFNALHASDAGVVHQDVDVAEFHANGIHQAIDSARQRDVGLNGGTTAPQARNLTFGVFRVGSPSLVVDRQVGACPSQCHRDRAADAATGTSDQRDLASQFIHRSRLARGEAAFSFAFQSMPPP